MRVESRVTSLSWIPSEAAKGMLRKGFSTHLAEYDDPPPDVIDDDAVQADAYHVRFANRLRAWAEFEDRRVVAHGMSGGVVMGRTAVKIGPFNGSFAAIGMPDLRPEPDTGNGWIRFTQTPGDSLYLLLDGIVAVDVDGAVLTELGPGVVVGERAVLEGGVRTATLTAVTKIRIAEARADAIDHAALRRLSAGHRREEQRT